MKLEILHESRYHFSDVDLSDIMTRIESGENMASIARDYQMNYMTFRGRVKRAIKQYEDEQRDPAMTMNWDHIASRIYDIRRGEEDLDNIARDYGMSINTLRSEIDKAIERGQIHSDVRDAITGRNMWNTEL